MTDHTVTTDQPIVGGGIRSVHFFNGRLLTGEDLTREQEANALARVRLGRALGAGVAVGLEVSASSSTSNTRPIVRVERGLAVNRQGRVLELPGATELALTRERADETGAEVLFHDCTPFQPGTYSAGAGVYLLTIAPAVRNEGRAKVSGLGNEDATCNVAFTVEGVQFHLLKLALPTSVATDLARLRNRLAHLMTGTTDPRRRALDRSPLGPPATAYGLVDDLRQSGCLTDAQVPLTVLMWTASSGVRFIDLWAVRRPIVSPPCDGRFSTLIGDRRRAEAEAIFLQFQAQIADASLEGTALSSVTVANRFAFLPPVGIVPITGSGSTAGFDPDRFLGDQGSDELATTDSALVRTLVEESLTHEPIVVGGDERIQRYLVWDNELAVRARTTGQRVMVFAKRTLPYRGLARYGIARFGRSRFAPSIYSEVASA